MCNSLLPILVLWPMAGCFFVWFMSGRSFTQADSDKEIKGYNPLKLWLMTLGVIGFEAFILIAAILYGPVVNSDSFRIERIAGLGLGFRLDGFRVVYSSLTTVMWLCSTLVCREYFTHGSDLMRYHIFSLLTYTGTMGVFLSDDLFTTFVFFEIMSIASYAYVAHTEKPESMRASGTYLAVAVIGGLVMLMGVLMLDGCCHTLEYRQIREAVETYISSGVPGAGARIWVAGGLILFGFGAKAGCFPLHIWLPKAHPVAPAPASALLSGVLTKSGIFGVLILCLEIFREDAGFGLLISILGMLTMLTGAVLAVFSTDLKRTLACSSVSQIGFILIGCGLVPLLREECTLALSGAMLYMVNHSLFKLTLFLSAAVVYMKLHKLDLNEIRGFGRKMPFFRILFLIGALGISGVPMLSGYVAKTLIHEGIVEYVHIAEGGREVFFSILEWLYLISGGMTFAYMTKLFCCIFVDEPGKKAEAVGERGHGRKAETAGESRHGNRAEKADESRHGNRAETADVHEHKQEYTDSDIGRFTYAAILVPAVLIVVFGVLAKLYISKLAVFMGNFNTAAYDHESLEVLENLSIFSLENLKGSMISISLGIIFFFLIRRFLCRKENGVVIYLDRWPKWLDIEELIYRPVLLRFFPFLFRTVGVFIAKTLPESLFRGTMWLAAYLTRLAASLFDHVLNIFERTLFRPFVHRDHPRVNSIKKVALQEEQRARIISSTLSYGMALVCIGLLITLMYLLYLLFS